MYTIQYNRSKSSTSSPLIVNKVLDLEKFNSARIACNQNNILLYTTHQQSSSIRIYDNQFKQQKIFHSSTNKQLPVLVTLIQTNLNSVFIFYVFRSIAIHFVVQIL
jgi:hypothetical protein